MAAEIHIGQGRRRWFGSRDDSGHRTFTLVTQVKCTSPLDGPATVMNCPGLPTMGSPWNFGNDLDFWAFCHPQMTVTPRVDNEKNVLWEVSQKFSTRPIERCQDIQIEDPLLEPQKVSGSFIKYTKEAAKDVFDQAILSSSHEPIRGPKVEVDYNRPTVRIEQNVPILGLATFTEMIDHLNDEPLWGLDERCIKLSGISWTRNVRGICDEYYTRIFDFDIDFETFDRDIADEGAKALGRWDTNTSPAVWDIPAGWVKTNPAHFTRYRDPNGNIARTLLDGNGSPLNALVAGAGVPIPISGVLTEDKVSFYSEANFLLLGIPTSF